MSEEHLRKIIIRIDGSADRPTQLLLIAVPKPERVLKAIKSLAIFWACAGAAVFVPILHFVLVPAFSLAGLFFATNSYFDLVHIDTRQTLSCSKCSSNMVLQNSSDHFPKWDFMSGRQVTGMGAAIQ